MADELAGAASAQPPAAAESAPLAPAPVSAERAAADAGDYASFDRAHVAKRQGKSVPAVDPASAPRVPPEADAADSATTGERAVSKRQQAINDYERRIAQQEQRIQELEHRTRAAPPAPSQPPPPAPGESVPAQETPKQRVARLLALPEAPKIDDFDTYPEYTAAQTLFLHDLAAKHQAAQTAQRAMRRSASA
jgi:hypothetical protein